MRYNNNNNSNNYNNNIIIDYVKNEIDKFRHSACIQ